MNAPLELRLLEDSPAVAVALFVPGDTESLLRVIRRKSVGSRWLVMHAVRDGFVVELPTPSEERIPGTVPLRLLAGRLYVPCGTDLSPALLPDEAAALTRHRGLLFLPGGECFELSAQALTPADVLRLPLSPTLHPAQPLPSRPTRPSELREVRFLSDGAPTAVVEPGGAGISVETPRPPGTGPMTELASGATARLGRWLIQLGNKVGWKGLAELGAALIAKAVEVAPRVSEMVIGKQAAALQELLRRFREGDTEEALKRALPLNNKGGGRGGQVADNADLPHNSLLFDLRHLLGQGRASPLLWQHNDDAYHELQSEYRKAAEKAVACGDHHRAAFIFGRLLGEWQTAADVLMRGGMHREAATIYLEVTHDLLAAARAFEACGEYEKALELYQNRSAHVPAGDLLKRMGEMERALAQYRLASDHEAAMGHHVQAAEMMLRLANRSDLAEEYLIAGWAQRPRHSAGGCLLRLAELRAIPPHGKPDALIALIDEADAYFAAVEDVPLARGFYNELARLTTQSSGTPVQPWMDTVRDRALLGLTQQLRQLGGQGATRPQMVANLFNMALWPAALLRDAEIALGRLGGGGAAGRGTRMRVHRGVVTAACGARGQGDVFVGYEDGKVVHYAPQTRTGTILSQEERKGPVLGLSTSAEGRLLVQLMPGMDTEATAFMNLRYPETWGVIGSRSLGKGDARLSPVAKTRGETGGDGRPLLGVRNDRTLSYLGGYDLIREHSISVGPNLLAALILDSRSMVRAQASTVLVYPDSLRWPLLPAASETGRGESELLPASLLSQPLPLPWHLDDPAIPGLPSFDWLISPSGQLEIAGVLGTGELGWTSARVLSLGTVTRWFRKTGHWRAVALVGPGVLAGVQDDAVIVLAAGEYSPIVRGEIKVSLPGACACFHLPQSRELLVVCEDGDCVRVPLP